MCVYIYIYMCVCMFIYAYYIFIYLCVYIYMYTDVDIDIVCLRRVVVRVILLSIGLPFWLGVSGAQGFRFLISCLGLRLHHP